MFILNRGPNEEENRQRAKWILLLRSWPVHSHFDRQPPMLLLRVCRSLLWVYYWEIGQSAAAEIEWSRKRVESEGGVDGLLFPGWPRQGTHWSLGIKFNLRQSGHQFDQLNSW